MTDHLLPLRVAVTGGTAGLGLSLVRELLARGAHVAFIARHRDDVERTLIDFPAAREGNQKNNVERTIASGGRTLATTRRFMGSP